MMGGPNDARKGDQAALGAVVVMAVIWVAIVGFHLYQRAWNDALFWAAIAVATSASSITAIRYSRRR
jgi:Kef-type K+ transport system membrane component KefB